MYDNKKDYNCLMAVQLAAKQISLGNPNYPYLLKQISDPPKKLFYRGQYQLFNWLKWRFLAIIGTRQPSEYDCQIAHSWAGQLAKKRIVLVSGLALGIDTIVHREAVLAGTPTIAVLGSAIDYIYPYVNSKLYWQIINQKGLILSEFGPGTKVPTKLFVTRNRIISGLCRSLLLIGGGSFSGTLITARYALEQGREVMIVPENINQPQAQAGLILLKQGATPVSSVNEVLEAI